MVSEASEETPWGRVLITGGVHWAGNGRKDRPPASKANDLPSPHIIRSLSAVKVTRLLTGPAANYAMVLDIRGNAQLFGKSPALALGANTNGIISEQAPLKVTPASVGLSKGTKFIGGAVGRNHALLVDSQGGVWGCGNNITGQLGLPTTSEIEEFTRISGPWKDEKVIQVTAGISFSLFLTESGKVYASGSSESGQLGNGKTGHRIVKGNKSAFDVEVPPRLVNALSEKKILKIASGSQHSLALDEEGYVYAWGFAGYGRLGLQDSTDRLVPTLVPTFTGKEMSRGLDIACGPTNSVVIDRSKLYYMAGKWKITGDGGNGQPYTSFKSIVDIMGCRVIKASCGGCTHFITTPTDKGGIMTVGWGQGTLYGELGLGEEKSSTKPKEIEALRGLDVIDVAGGAFFTLFLAKPSDKLSELPRYPEHIDSASVCLACNKVQGDANSLLECEKCDEPYHLGCLDPPLKQAPDGEWFCPECIREQLEEEEEEDREAEQAGAIEKKRKASPTKSNGRGKKSR